MSMCTSDVFIHITILRLFCCVLCNDEEKRTKNSFVLLLHYFPSRIKEHSSDGYNYYKLLLQQVKAINQDAKCILAC